MRHVLLVEDEPDARTLMACALERAGYVCTSAADVEGARGALTRGGSGPSVKFDAAVLDIVLGADEGAGIELVSAVKASCPHAVVVVVTAFADLFKVKRALNAGAGYLLEKPFAARELLSVLDKLLAEAHDVSWLADRALAAARLTDKELAIARLVLKGLPTAEIARLEGNSDKTIRQHLSQIYAKCGVQSRAEFFHFVFPT